MQGRRALGIPPGPFLCCTAPWAVAGLYLEPIAPAGPVSEVAPVLSPGRCRLVPSGLWLPALETVPPLSGGSLCGHFFRRECTAGPWPSDGWLWSPIMTTSWLLLHLSLGSCKGWVADRADTATLRRYATCSLCVCVCTRPGGDSVVFLSFFWPHPRHMQKFLG